MDNRTHYIRSIRAALPYLPEKELSYIYSFAETLRCRNGLDFSASEHRREVLTPEQQQQADTASDIISSVGFAISEEFQMGYCFRESGSTAASPLRVIGECNKEEVILDARLVAQVYREAWCKRIKRDTLFRMLEDFGYIIPRRRCPQKALFNGEMREVLYTTAAQLRPFLREDSIILPRDTEEGVA